MSSIVDLRFFLHRLAIVSEKAASIARHIRSMQSEFDATVQSKQRKTKVEEKKQRFTSLFSF